MCDTRVDIVFLGEWPERLVSVGNGNVIPEDDPMLSVVSACDVDAFKAHVREKCTATYVVIIPRDVCPGPKVLDVIRGASRDAICKTWWCPRSEVPHEYAEEMAKDPSEFMSWKAKFVARRAVRKEHSYGQGAPGFLGAPRMAWVSLLDSELFDAASLASHDWRPAVRGLTTRTAGIWNMSHTIGCAFYSIREEHATGPLCNSTGSVRVSSTVNTTFLLDAAALTINEAHDDTRGDTIARTMEGGIAFRGMASVRHRYQSAEEDVDDGAAISCVTSVWQRIRDAVRGASKRRHQRAAS